MGSLRHESRHLLYPPQQRNSPVPSSTAIMTSPISVLAAQLKNSTSSSPSAGCKEPNNESMDSGVAGLRDGLTTPHGGSPTSATSSSSSSSHVLLNHHHAQQQQSALATTPSSTLLLPPVHDDGLQYIVDRSKNTTYLKGRFLGKGGFARVHELTDLTTGHVYAGKIIPKSRITKPHHKEKIAREIELHRNLVHLNVVRFYHCFEDSENVYIILENCSKKSLVHVMKHRKTLTEPEVRFYLRQLADGLRYVHGARIVHRDLKLGNMFLSENMTVKIGDFGLAARLHAETKVTICGTPNYIAPEVLSRQGHGYEADLWAMGCIMYAMLVGQPPFETSTLAETYSRIAHNMYVIPQWVSRPARSLIRQLLAPDPAHRPTLDQVLKHDFFTSGFMPVSLPPSCCSKAPTFASNDSGIKSDGDSTNENTSPLAPHHLRVPSSFQGNRSRPESVKVPSNGNNQSQKDQRVARSHSLKETPACRKEKKEAQQQQQQQTQQQQQQHRGLPGSLKQKITNVLCPDRTTDDHNNKEPSGRVGPPPPPTSAAPAVQQQQQQQPSLYTALDSCLYHAAQVPSNPCPVPCNPLFISKWIDYSNKYGFGFQLSDRAVGVLFNDSTRISYSGDRNRLDFQDATGKTSSYSLNALPSYLMERLTLLRYFAQYMDENLTEGGDSQQQQEQASTTPSTSPVHRRRSFVHMKRWVRTPKAIIMQLDNNTLQINFFKDHTKIVLSADTTSTSAVTQYWVTYINSDRLSATYRLVDISQLGCESTLRERLVFALTVLREFAELDGDKI
ncbi:serine/threonine-protein kinase PLK1-like [Daphnia pulex]|uniref:serine/threonine-protein kinase PLK1-like n=1 Tax=Daphnia pulex TaxID=6669 RepID=UPI001EDCE8ED|nr:serine/threonine-protein kinase PLK1-like [Daphnia pulex]